MIPWIPLIAAGASLLGSLVGNQSSVGQKENTATNETQASITTSQVKGSTKQNETQSQTQSTDSVTSSIDKAIQNALQTTEQVTSEQQKAQTNQGTTGTTAENVLTSNTQTDAQQTAEQTLQNQTQQVSRLDETTLDQLTTAVRSAVSGSTTGVTKSRLDEVSSSGDMFDVDSYVDKVMGGARTSLAQETESLGNQIQSKSGASSRTNSAAALLKAKIAQQGATQLGALEADTIAKGTQIRDSLAQSKTGQITNLAAANDKSTATLLGSLLQAQESGTTASTGSSSGTQTGTSIGNQNTQQTGSSAQNTNTTSDTSTSGSQKGSQATNTNTTQTNDQTQSTDVTSQLTSLIDTITKQKQTDKTAGTDVTKTISGITKDTKEMNWGDFFSNIGKAFSASF